MASRRMFSARVTESTRFIKMPATSQNLYFHLGMHADDDGVVEAYPVMCTIGASEDDLRVLISKGFATLLNDDMVTFLNDWLENNNIRSDRKVDSIYKDLLVHVIPYIELKEPKESYYSRVKKDCPSNDRQVTDILQANVGIGKDRLGKVSLGKVSLGKDKINNIVEVDSQLSTLCHEVIDYLNQKSNTNYRTSSEASRRHIIARINEGYSLEQFKQVIDTKVEEWLDTDMAKYLRPQTLFGTKFENYLNQQCVVSKLSYKPCSLDEYDIPECSEDIFDRKE